jgi:transposase
MPACAGMTAPFVPTLQVRGVYLQIQQHIPEDRIVEIVKSLYGIELATDTVANMRKARAEQFKAFAEAVGERVKKAPVKNMDETGFHVAGTSRRRDY